MMIPADIPKLTSVDSEASECENCDWVWSNGQNYCPYCQNQIQM
jgi:hypothetical protein